MKELQIIPQPVRVKQRDGVFVLTPQTTILTAKAYRPIAVHLAQMLAQATGFDFEVKAGKSRMSPAGSIVLLAGTDSSALMMGSEACLWTKQIPERKVHEKTFPRLLAFSETVWSPRKARDWNRFKKRVATHFHWLDEMGVSYWGG